MQIEVIVDRELEDGRFVVTNNSRIDIPIGSLFTALFGRTAKLVEGEFRDRQESSAASVELKIVEAELWRKPHSCIPFGHHAAIRLAGDVSFLKEKLQSRLPNWQIFLSAG